MKAGIPVANAWMAYAKCRYKPEAKILHHSFPFTIWIFVLAAALINLSLLPRTLDQNWTGEGSCLWKQLFSSTLSPKQLPFFETKTEPERGSKLKKKAPRHKIYIHQCKVAMKAGCPIMLIFQTHSRGRMWGRLGRITGKWLLRGIWYLSRLWYFQVFTSFTATLLLLLLENARGDLLTQFLFDQPTLRWKLAHYSIYFNCPN